jgi:hypothetical protein
MLFLKVAVVLKILPVLNACSAGRKNYHIPTGYSTAFYPLNENSLTTTIPTKRSIVFYGDPTRPACQLFFSTKAGEQQQFFALVGQQ